VSRRLDLATLFRSRQISLIRRLRSNLFASRRDTSVSARRLSHLGHVNAPR
jgi:hypothetical protein